MRKRAEKRKPTLAQSRKIQQTDTRDECEVALDQYKAKYKLKLISGSGSTPCANILLYETLVSVMGRMINAFLQAQFATIIQDSAKKTELS